MAVLRRAVLAAGVFGLVACTPPASGPGQSMVTSFTNISDTQVTIQADAPSDVIRQLAICKATWFAEKAHKQTMSLGNPHYAQAANQAAAAQLPAGWARLTATAYFGSPNPDGNPVLQVASLAPGCRCGFDWYR